MVGVSTQLVNCCCPHGRRNYTCCTVAPLPSLLPALPPVRIYSIYRQCVAVGGGVGVFSCVVDHILQEFYTLFLTRFRTDKIASPPQIKMTSIDDI
jgi:hypothetical protein